MVTVGAGRNAVELPATQGLGNRGHLSTDPKHSWGRSRGSGPLSTSVPWWQRTPGLTSQLLLPGVSPHAVHFPTALTSLFFHAEADTQLFIWLEMVRVSPALHTSGAWLGLCTPVPAPVNTEVPSALLRELERAQPRVSHTQQA